MLDRLVDVLRSGAVCLGSEVVCDGFTDGYLYRVQSHVHDDHMGDFNTSKGQQHIFMSPGTYDLLVTEHNIELEYRDNLCCVPCGTEHVFSNGQKLSLVSSNHMLGASQVALELPNGVKLGYSGDFGWPLDEVIQVDQLVVDSTYGNPDSIRRYSQSEAEASFLEIVNSKLRHGSVNVLAHRGTIERVVRVLAGQIHVPLLATRKRIQEIDVYRKYGLPCGVLISLDSEEGQKALKERSYIRLYSKGDGYQNEPSVTSIVCSAFMMARADSPVMQHSEKSYAVALSNHADFAETLEYIRATNAEIVVTDNTRNHGCDLALAIKEHLPGVHAIPSTNQRLPNFS